MPTILHFADAHIDMANYGRHDPDSGLPLRVLDFLKSLDAIVTAAIERKVDLVLFAGDAYRDRAPSPTFQREWGRRIMRLSRAGIPTLLLIGNHDLSPAHGRAHAIQEFDTLEVPNVKVIAKPTFLKPADLGGVPLQIIALPWVSRSGAMAALDLSADDPAKIYEEMEARITDLIHTWLEEADPDLPMVLTAHASVQGAVYGTERSVMVGSDMILPASLVRDSRLDYVALGHIHKPQNLNEDGYPPVVYPGSIERVDFGEASDQKYFIIADIKRKLTQFKWMPLTEIRPFIDRYLRIESADQINEKLLKILEPMEALTDAIVRLTVDYPKEWEALIDEPALRQAASGAFEFHLNKRPITEARIRIPENQTISGMKPLDLLDLYWGTTHTDSDDTKLLNKLAIEVIEAVTRGDLPGEEA